jgi:hypothetical protein
MKVKVIWLDSYSEKLTKAEIAEADFIFVEVADGLHDVVKNRFNGVNYKYATTFVCDKLVEAANNQWFGEVLGERRES